MGASGYSDVALGKFHAHSTQSAPNCLTLCSTVSITKSTHPSELSPKITVRRGCRSRMCDIRRFERKPIEHAGREISCKAALISDEYRSYAASSSIGKLPAWKQSG